MKMLRMQSEVIYSEFPVSERPGLSPTCRRGINDGHIGALDSKVASGIVKVGYRVIYNGRDGCGISGTQGV